MNRDAMLGQNHDVYHEFPEYVERIDNLKQTDKNFARLVEKYTDVNRKVIRVEQGIEPRDHFSFEQLKKRRLLHKDQLYSILKN